MKIETLEKHTVDSEADPGGSELFDMLVWLAAGKTLTVVRGTQEMNGYLAWKRLCERFNPNTPPKALALMMAIMIPQHQTDRTGSPKPLMGGTQRRRASRRSSARRCPTG